MLTGWQKVGGTWYYMYDSGAMAANTWIGSYYVNGSGAWVQNSTSYPAGDYNVGTVYGPSLTRAELDQVAAAVQKSCVRLQKDTWKTAVVTEKRPTETVGRFPEK